MKVPASKLDVDFVRSKFPAQQNDFVFFDNAGGAQVPKNVINCISEYLEKWNVQLGASYSISSSASELHLNTHLRLSEYIGADNVKEIIVGSSTTMLLRILSLCLSKKWTKGDEVIISNTDHEANISCWNDLREIGITVKVWEMNPLNYELEIEDLKKLLTPKTKLVTISHVSNILGTINPIKEIGEVVHKAGALFAVDGVAFAPHREINVKEWGVDFYVFSTYKVFGPHQAILYGKLNLLENLNGINHYFIKDTPYKFQPGNFNFELTYGLNGTLNYFEDLYCYHLSHRDKQILVSDRYEKVFELIGNHEEILSEKLLTYLESNKKIDIIGSKECKKHKRVSTISFVHKNINSKDIVETIDKYGIGIRYGDFYAKKIIESLGLESKNGVVRVSMVHYNTVEEIDRLIDIFDKHL